MSNRQNPIFLASRKLPSAPKDMPTLRGFWEELKRARENGDAALSTSARSGFWLSISSGRLYGSGNSSGLGWGSGSGGNGCAGYGIGLIASDEESQERIRAIMRELCERGK